MGNKIMTRSEAIQVDEEFYADYDDQTNDYGVFGVTSGFCYSTWTDLDEAEKRARRMSAEKKLCDNLAPFA